MILVTGIAGPIGAAVAEVLADRAVEVVGVDIKTPAEHRCARFIQLDLTDETAVNAAALTLRQDLGGLDAIVHAAAMTSRSPDLAPHSLRTVDLALWRRVLDVNLTGALVCARAFGALLRPGPLAQILMVGSIQGLVPTVGSSAYAVSKAALTGLVRQLAAEFAADGIRVNLASPGTVAGDSEVAALATMGLAETSTPLAHFARPREMGEAIADLATGAFGLMTGVVIPLDSGEHLRPRMPFANKDARRM